TSCSAISKPRSRPSSTTTTTAAITRASTISPRPTSTSDAAQPSWPSEKGSSDRPLLTAACSTGCRPPDFTNPMSQSLPYFTQPVVSETLTTDRLSHEKPCPNGSRKQSFYRSPTTLQ